jgi:hypothetical protein
MKKGLYFAVALVLVLFGALSVYAVTTSGPINVTANINAGTPDMTVVIHKLPNGDWQQINWLETLSAMNFNKFTVVSRTVGGTPVSQWTSVDLFAAFVYADGLGKQYSVTSTGTGTFSDGAGHTLPAGSFACIPVYTADDEWKYPDGTTMKQGAMPSGAVLGSKGMALQANKPIYTSENPGSARILQSMYAFPPYNVDGSTPYSGYAAIPANQVNGTYTGPTVTVNITAL